MVALLFAKENAMFAFYADQITTSRRHGEARRGTVHAYSKCFCEIRLRGFRIQTAPVPLISSPEASPDPDSNVIVFYLEESDVKALALPRCFRTSQAYLDIVVYMGRQSSHCGVTGRKQQIGSLRLEIGPEWGLEKPALLHNGWMHIGQNKRVAEKHGPELHLKVKLDPDPRYVFKFEDETTLSPQIVQLQGTIKQPIFSCKFIQDRRTSPLDLISGHWTNSNTENHDAERRERKGWKVMIHDLSGSAVAAAFMATPFVPSMGCDRVARSNPGAWLILRPDPISSSESWHPWGRLEAWRETGPRDTVCLRLHILPEGQDTGILVSDVAISSDKGGEFYIDMDRQMPVGISVGKPQGSTGRRTVQQTTGSTCSAACPLEGSPRKKGFAILSQHNRDRLSGGLMEIAIFHPLYVFSVITLL
ncbi:hypothetical protein OPV22_003303 [Ensete ventricosum]|uniref:Uncharacterized protein n=1 Tax=Ensete ventricosum TaxID=4639 RepID=A0AAV8S0F7_ENSVE|nr:hypothetical protein OPV22_003303 [Ensete ventricosum]